MMLNSNNQKGELALTVALLSFVLMTMGAVTGSLLNKSTSFISHGQSTGCSYYAQSMVKYEGNNPPSSFSWSSSINTNPVTVTDGIFPRSDALNPPDYFHYAYSNKWETQNMPYDNKTASISLKNVPENINIKSTFCSPESSSTCQNIITSPDYQTISNLKLKCNDTIYYGWRAYDLTTKTSPIPTRTHQSGQPTGSPAPTTVSSAPIGTMCTYRPRAYINIVTNPLDDSKNWQNRYFTEAQRLGWKIVNDKNVETAFNAQSACYPYGINGSRCAIGSVCDGYTFGSDRASVSLIPSTNAEKYDVLGYCKNMNEPQETDSNKLNCWYYDDPIALHNNVPIAAISDLPICIAPPGTNTNQSYEYGWVIRERPAGVTPVPSQGFGTPIPTPKLWNHVDQGYIESHRLACGAGFEIRLAGKTKTQIDDLILTNYVTKEQFALRNADRVEGDNSATSTSPVGEIVGRSLLIKGVDLNYIKYNVELSWNPSRTVYEHQGVQKGSLVVILSDAYDNKNIKTTYYYYNPSSIPSWINSSNEIEAALYYTIVASRYPCPMNKRFVDKVLTQACTNVTLTPPVTKTPTPPVTKTPTITITRTPTQTETACNANVHFLLDASTTIELNNNFRSVRNKLSEKIRQYFTSHPLDEGRLAITYQYFTYNLEPVQTLTSPYEFPDYVDKHIDANGVKHRYTNIQKALTEGIRGTTVFVSDGIPSVGEDSIFSKNGKYCVFNVAQCMARDAQCNLSENPGLTKQDTYADGCLVNGFNRSLIRDNACDDVERFCEKISYQQILDATVNTANKQADFGYLVEKEDTVPQVVSEASKVYSSDFADLPDQLGTIIAKACNKSVVNPTVQPNPTTANVFKPKELLVTYKITNNSSKKINSTQLVFCDEGGESCIDKTFNQQIESGATYRTTEILDTSKYQFKESSDKIVASCTIAYNDGSTKLCTEDTVISIDSSIQVILTATDSEVLSETALIRDVLDFNHDSCLNSIDFAQLKKKIQSTDTDETAFGKYNSQYTSILVSKYGDCWE